MVLLVASSAIAAGDFFIDDDGDIHEDSIDAIAAAGITKGCNPPANNRFCPSSSVTRGQMAAFLVRALKLPAVSGDYFTDDAGSVFENDINRLAASGVTKGCNPPANDRFCPDSKVTREQMAAFLVRGFDLDDPGDGDLFVDDGDSIFQNDINSLARSGVTKGCNPPANDRFCPKSNVLGDQMASFLARAIILDPIPPNCDPSYPDFCIPPPPPDLDCGDILQTNFTVLQPDPHGFDADKDGIGCET